MVVDDQNNFITARVYPELLRVKTSVNSSILTLRNSEMEPVYVNLAEVVSSLFVLFCINIYLLIRYTIPT